MHTCILEEIQHVTKQSCITNRNNQSGFHFLILYLKDSKKGHFYLSGAKAKTFGIKEEIVYFPYFTVRRTLKSYVDFESFLQNCGRKLIYMFMYL